MSTLPAVTLSRAFTPTELKKLRAVVHQPAPRRISAGRSIKPERGTTYAVHEVELHDGSYTVVSGKQESSRARLLDAAAGYRAVMQTPRHVIALLDGVGQKARADILPEAGYIKRFQAAAYRGLGVYWLTDKIDWFGDESVDLLSKELQSWAKRAINALDAASPEIDPNNPGSRASEKRIREVLDRSGANLGTFLGTPHFNSFYRTGIPDGVWEQDGKKFALEVKVQEDRDAPFGQIIDDLGAYDGVLQVRLTDGSAAADPTQINEWSKRLCEVAPVRIVQYSRGKRTA